MPTEQYFETPTVLEFVPTPHVETPKEYAQRIWGDQFVYADFIITKESGWDAEAQNKHSSAFGLHQFLDATWKDMGCVKTGDTYVQLDCGKKYIEQRYGTAKEAVEHWKLEGWY